MAKETVTQTAVTQDSPMMGLQLVLVSNLQLLNMFKINGKVECRVLKSAYSMQIDVFLHSQLLNATLWHLPFHRGLMKVRDGTKLYELRSSTSVFTVLEKYVPQVLIQLVWNCIYCIKSCETYLFIIVFRKMHGLKMAIGGSGMSNIMTRSIRSIQLYVIGLL